MFHLASEICLEISLSRALSSGVIKGNYIIDMILQVDNLFCSALTDMMIEYVIFGIKCKSCRQFQAAY